MKKKLIEVALPLDAINEASAKEKSIRHGHPSTLHLWWARRPLATCRAVIFASLVDDPSSLPDQFPTEEAQAVERERLFDIIRDLVKWENTNNQKVLELAKAEIMRSTDGKPPPLLDPFCGGGSIPLEAQRLGLEAHGSDLNPVAVLITKALIEIPPKFANKPPVNSKARQKLGGSEGWVGARNLAEDVRYYGQWIRDEAERRVGHLYPRIQLPMENGGGELMVIAWLWARTVTCPNPACQARMPLVRSFALSTKKGKEACVEPIVDREAKTVRFEVQQGKVTPPEGTVNRQGATCIICGTAVPFDHVRTEGKAGRMSAKLMAIVGEGRRGRVYLAPTPEQEVIASSAQPEWIPDTELSGKAAVNVPLYGMTKHRNLFTSRQLVILTTFSDLVHEVRDRIVQDAVAVGLADDGAPLAEGGCGATAYGDAIATYLAFAVDRSVDRGSTICTWDSSPKMEALRNTFARQAIPMTWDFAEGNPFSDSSGNWLSNTEWIAMVVDNFTPSALGRATQMDAMSGDKGLADSLVCTDPPYYDNIGYADLSDFFYVWLRRSLCSIYPELFKTLLAPKAQELVAAPHRFHGSKARAQQFFEQGLADTFANIRALSNENYPVTVYYAFKQAESDDNGVAGEDVIASTGWETMLSGLIKSGFNITGTWPMRSELSNRMIASGTNALASSIVLVCRPRSVEASRATRRDFVNALRTELPTALRELQSGAIAPVDLAQATIGPGMAIFSRYSQVIEADGSPLRVRTALQLINQALDEVLMEQEGEFDADTRWAITWFEQFGTDEGQSGQAETLSTAKNTSLRGLEEAGIARSRSGKVRLLRREELPAEWDPSEDKRLTVWESVQHLIRALESSEIAAAALLAKLGEIGDMVRDLAYRLYTSCERKGWSQEAIAYNSLVIAWPEIVRLANQQSPVESETQLSF